MGLPVYVSNRKVSIYVRVRVRARVSVSDICALTFKDAALTGEEAECDYRPGKRKDLWREGERKESSQERIVLNYHPLHIPDFS